MEWQQAVLYGAVGGFIVEAVVTSTRILAWNSARHAAIAEKKASPSLLEYIDPMSDAAAAATRLILGAAAGWLFHNQISGVDAAIAVGCSAPALLRQLASSSPPALKADLSSADRVSELVAGPVVGFDSNAASEVST